MQFEMTTVWCDGLWESHVYLLKTIQQTRFISACFFTLVTAGKLFQRPDDSSDGRKLFPARTFRRTDDCPRMLFWQMIALVIIAPIPPESPPPVNIRRHELRRVENYLLKMYTGS